VTDSCVAELQPAQRRAAGMHGHRGTAEPRRLTDDTGPKAGHLVFLTCRPILPESGGRGAPTGKLACRPRCGKAARHSSGWS
jgi:hypothetical protein